MEIDALIKEMKNIHSLLIDFIDAAEDSDSEFNALIDFFDEQKILQNQEEVRLIFQLISKIANNHHRTSDFLDKLDKIFQYLIKDFPSPISYFIPDRTDYNKLILFLLFGKKYVEPDQSFFENFFSNKKAKKDQFHFNHFHKYLSNEYYEEMQIYYFMLANKKKQLEAKSQKQLEA